MKRLEDLIEHLAVLRRDADFNVEEVRLRLEVTQYRTEFNGLRPRSKQEEYTNRQKIPRKPRDYLWR